MISVLVAAGAMAACRSDDNGSSGGSAGRSGSSGGGGTAGGTGGAGSSGGTGGAGAAGGAGSSGRGGSAGGAGTGGSMPYTGNVKGLRMNTPADNTSVTVQNVIVLGFTGNWKTMYVQDEMGGEYSGIGVFCDFERSCTAWNSMNAAMTATRGDKLTIVGNLDRFTPSMPAGAREQLQIRPMMVMKTGMGTPTAVEVPAADLAKTAMNNAKWKGVYVRTTMGGPWSVTNLMPTELVNSGYMPCRPGDGGMICCSNGPHYGGFEITGGILVGTSWYRAIALSDMECARTTGMMPDHVVTMTDRFSVIGGVFDDSFGAQQIFPTVDGDYTLQ